MLDLQNIKTILVIKDKKDHAEYVAKYSEHFDESALVIDLETFNSIKTEENEIWKSIFEMNGKFFRCTDSRKDFTLYAATPSRHLRTSVYDVKSEDFITIRDFMPIPTNFYFKK